MGDFYYWSPAPKVQLPSFDINSLHVLTYIKLCGAKVELHPTLKSFIGSGSRSLPRFHTADDEDIFTPTAMIQHLKENGFDLDANIPGSITKDILPLSALIEDRLLPAVLYTFWMDQENYGDVTHQMYAKNCRFPLNFNTPLMLQKGYEFNLREAKCLGENEEVDAKTANKKLIKPCLSVLNQISEFLGEKDFILGEQPSSLDALLFSVLAPITESKGKLCDKVKSLQNIVRYINRIQTNHFKDEIDAQGPPEIIDPEAVNWMSDVVLPISVVSIVMTGYAANLYLNA